MATTIWSPAPAGHPARGDTRHDPACRPLYAEGGRGRWECVEGCPVLGADAEWLNGLLPDRGPCGKP